jgi:dipeptidyl aminopeptidase/acylaminoacyl peptidase
VFARPFDPERLEFSGAEVQVTERAGDVSVSDNGTIVYRPNGVSVSRLTWFDRSGLRTGTLGELGPYDQMVLPPRGRHATVVRGDAQGNAWDLWDVDIANEIFSRLTTDPTDDADPSWSPDERTLAFLSWRTGRRAVFMKDLTTGKETPLVPFAEGVALDQWTPDGQFIIFRTLGKAVYAMPLGGDRTPRMLVDTPFIEDEVHVSPDGRWVAFDADESGRWEVYVAAFPAFTSKRQISSAGGVQPQWRADGRELFYLGPDGSMMSVRVEALTEFTATPPTRLFATNIAADPMVPKYGVTADGQRFLGLDRAAGNRNFTVLINWLNRPVSGAP